MKMITNTMLLAGCLALGNICAVQASGALHVMDKLKNLPLPDMESSDEPSRRSCSVAPSNLQRMESHVSLGPEVPEELIKYFDTFESEKALGKFIEDTIKTALTNDKEIVEFLRKNGMKVMTCPTLKLKIFKMLDTLVLEAIDNAGWKQKLRLTKRFNDYPSLKVGEDVTVVKTNTDDWSVVIRIGQRPVHLTSKVWEEYFQPQGFNSFEINKLKDIWKQKSGDRIKILKLIKNHVQWGIYLEAQILERSLFTTELDYLCWEDNCAGKTYPEIVMNFIRLPNEDFKTYLDERMQYAIDHYNNLNAAYGSRFTAWWLDIRKKAYDGVNKRNRIVIKSGMQVKLKNLKSVHYNGMTAIVEERNKNGSWKIIFGNKILNLPEKNLEPVHK